MSHRYWANPFPYSGTWTRTREPGPTVWVTVIGPTHYRTQEPGPVLGNLDLNRSLVWDNYSGTWTHTQEPEPILRNFEFDPYLFMYSGSRVQHFKKIPHILYFVLNLISMTFDALLLCHVSWVIGMESGTKKIGSSQKYEVEKLAQYQWDIR